MAINCVKNLRQRNIEWAAVSAALAADGFALFNSALFNDDDRRLFEARVAFLASCRNLPSDRYSKSFGRNRRYGRFIFNPQTNAVEVVPPIWEEDRNEYVTHYWQPDRFNPEHSGEPRAFASLTEMQSSNLFLRSLITKCFFTLPWTLKGPVFVGAHIVEFLVEPGHTVVSSPTNLHCDGEPFTWAFLIERTDVAGGENIFATPDAAGKNPDDVADDKIRARFTLKDTLEGWVVDDLKVCHYVSPVTVAKDAPIGRRTMLLVDFTPASDMSAAEIGKLKIA